MRTGRKRSAGALGPSYGQPIDGLVRLAEIEAIVILAAYVKAGIPVGGIVLAGRLSPIYRLPTSLLCRWWSRVALLVAAIPIAAAALR